MNNLKFRAWDKEFKNMIYTDDDLLVCVSNNGIELTDISETIGVSDGDIKDFELMQSTGLKDKNGVEIYEGDIVRYNRGVSHSVEKLPYSVKYVEGVFVFEYGFIQHNLFKNVKYITVIGNIYENEELLECGSDEEI